MTKDWDNPRPPSAKSSMREAVDAWNKCDISDAELQRIIDGARSTIEFLEAFGEQGILVGVLHQQLRSFEGMQLRRAGEKR